jgi:predicted DCC family thiol-disulfide oxidoreductase YuxK
MSALDSAEWEGPVLLFDGECGLCMRCVALLLKADRGGCLRYAPLQGSAAQALLKQRGLPTNDFDSAIFVPIWSQRHEARLVIGSEALLQACAAAGAGGWWLGWFRLMPKRWRDGLYWSVARLRRWLFGRGDLQTLLVRREWASRLLQ